MKKIRVIFIVCSMAIVVVGVMLYQTYVVPARFVETALPLPPNPLFRDANAPIEARVADLLSYMTLEEKIGQMALVEKDSLQHIPDVATYGIGGALSGAGAKPEENTVGGWRDMVAKLIEESKKSRLGIPLLYGADAMHGHANVPGATVFPHAIGLGATNDPLLVEEVARATAKEMVATNIYWSYSPNLDLPEDIRWGRTYEAFSDDPVRAALLGSAYVRGTQNGGSSTSRTVYVLSSPKHYVGNGDMIWESSSNKNFHIDQGTTLADETALQEVYLPPFKAAVDAGVLSLMVGLDSWGEGSANPEDFIVEELISKDSSLDGVLVDDINAYWKKFILFTRGVSETKLAASKYLVTDVLKGELGFTGFAVSDWYGVYEIEGGEYRAAVTAINAGIDMVMLPFEYKTYISNVTNAVKRKEIDTARIDDAVSRILKAKFALGLFDEVPTEDVSVVGSREHRELARKAAAASLVLLKNEEVLPIDTTVKHIRVAGSGADNIGRQVGAWTVEWQGIDGNWLPGATSILSGITARAGEKVRVEYDVAGTFKNETEMADVGIAVVSEKPYAEGWGDTAVPIVSEEDLRAIAELKKVSKKVVVVIISGRPLFVTGELPSWDGLVAAWLPGSEGYAIADVLFGDRPFVGTLPLPWPAYVEQLPITFDGETTDGTKVLFERGFGLR